MTLELDRCAKCQLLLNVDDRWVFGEQTYCGPCAHAEDPDFVTSVEEEDTERCTSCNWNVPKDEIVWRGDMGGDKLALCCYCSEDARTNPDGDY